MLLPSGSSDSVTALKLSKALVIHLGKKKYLCNMHTKLGDRPSKYYIQSFDVSISY